MDFAFSEEQQMLRKAARGYLADTYPLDRVAQLADGDGWDPASWPRLAEMGWLALAVDAEEQGTSFVDEAVLFEECGYALYPGPFLSSAVLALPARLAAGADGGISTGERTATLAWAEQGGPVTLADAVDVQCAARATGDGVTLHGTKRFVPDLAIVDDVVVVARSEDGVGLYQVDLTADRSVVVARSTTDGLRRLGDLVLDGTPATPLVTGPRALEVIADTRLRAMAAVACEAVGVAQRALDLAAAYASTREQFGRVIGTYQGVSHRVADIYVSLELARSLAYWAAWCVAVGDAQATAACAAAKSAAGEAAVFACENAIQAMGGIGFTWDHPLHRFYKRAQGIDAFEGGGRTHRAALATALLDA